MTLINTGLILVTDMGNFLYSTRDILNHFKTDMEFEKIVTGDTSENKHVPMETQH